MEIGGCAKGECQCFCGIGVDFGAHLRLRGGINIAQMSIVAAEKLFLAIWPSGAGRAASGMRLLRRDVIRIAEMGLLC